ncbi:MAG: hypothetical protein M3357_19715 [Actinomycetota bacterium]|nr:hypothetical protein [Actinomycetota bacterium]
MADNLWRSIVMLSPGACGLSREDAMRLLTELTTAEDRLAGLISELRRVIRQAEEGQETGDCPTRES